MEPINLSGPGHEVVDPGTSVVVVVGAIALVLAALWIISNLINLMDDT